MNAAAYHTLCELALAHSGQILLPSQRYLAEARLAAICRREGYASLEALIDCLAARPNPRFEAEIAAALTLKKTRFFDEKEQTQLIVEHALKLRLNESKNGRLRVWCAGVSTGQEAASLAIGIHEAQNELLKGVHIEIIGSDISLVALERLKTGLYGHFEIQKGLSVQRLLTHFNRMETGDWRLNQPVRRMISLRHHNLLKPAAELGSFDIIICRNVLSDMSPGARKTALGHLVAQLAPGGFLFAASSENLEGVLDTVGPSQDVRGAYTRRKALKERAVA